MRKYKRWQKFILTAFQFEQTTKNLIFGVNITSMLVERTNNDKIVITLSSSVDSFGLQRLIDYMKYLEATSKSKAKQSDVDKLADEVNASWWSKNRKRFIK